MDPDTLWDLSETSPPISTESPDTLASNSHQSGSFAMLVSAGASPDSLSAPTEVSPSDQLGLLFPEFMLSWHTNLTASSGNIQLSPPGLSSWPSLFPHDLAPGILSYSTRVTADMNVAQVETGNPELPFRCDREHCNKSFRLRSKLKYVRA